MTQTENCNTINRLSAALREKDKDVLAAALLDFEANSFEPATALCQRGLIAQKGSAERIIMIRKDSAYHDALYRMMKVRLETYQAGHHTYQQRRLILEEIIRILQPLYHKQSPPNIHLLTLLAQAYLYRGMLFGPRGFSTPARKIEAVKKAVQLADKAKTIAPDNTNAWRIWAHAVSELDILPDYDGEIPKDMMKQAALKITQHGISDAKDIDVLLSAAEFSSQDEKALVLPESWKSVLKDSLEETDHHLFEARAHLLQGKAQNAANALEAAIKTAPDTLADPFWDHLTIFLKRFRKSESPFWKPLAISAYNACREKEIAISDSIYLMRYWARQKELYDLAFIASDTPHEKACIADSLKCRTMLRDQVLQDIKDDAIRREFFELANEARDRRYLKKNPNLPQKIREKLSRQIQQRSGVSLEKLPKGWIAVHFYLNDLETSEHQTGGHALIFNPADEKAPWKDCPFDYRELFHEFVKWQQIYAVCGKDSERKKDALMSLCRKLAETMPFLFDGTLPNERKILWIPHGFLHRLPLHAALKDNTVFLNHHVCRYLPAWHLFTQTKPYYTGAKILLEHFEEFEFDKLKTSVQWEPCQSNATQKDFKLSAIPSVFAVLCHGEADILNPFNSCLKLNGFHLKISDILKIKPELTGTAVLLGACESDMAPPLEHFIDEHLSLSTVLLSHKASEVISGLWEVFPSKVDDCYSTLLNGYSITSDAAEILRNWQAEYLEENLEQDFYNVAPFRIVGLPWAVNKTDAE